MPFFVMDFSVSMIFQGLFLWLTGPFLAAYISPNLFEQASIWCFFSISQIAIMLWLIRSTLVSSGAKSVQDRGASLPLYRHCGGSPLLCVSAAAICDDHNTVCQSAAVQDYHAV